MAARSLGQQCTVVVPEATKEFMRDKLRFAGGDVVAHGKSLAECELECKRLLAMDPNGVYCPPYDDPAIWEGHSYLINEIYEEIGRPDAIVTAVGGGGLLIGNWELFSNRLANADGRKHTGVLEGLDRYNAGHDVFVLAMETIGAHSLHQSLKEDRLTTLPGITSIATSLGARRVAPKAFEVAQRPNVRSGVVSDAQAASSCVRLLDDERIAIEVSCGAAFAGLYSGVLSKSLRLTPESKVVVIACGGWSQLNWIHGVLLTRNRKCHQSEHTGRISKGIS